MAKITIDESQCTGCGLCEANCPECFKMGDDNLAHVTASSCDCDLNELVAQCPVSAITVA